MENFTENVLLRWMLGHSDDRKEGLCEGMEAYEDTASSQGAADSD